MTKYISEREIASVRLLTLEISEDELGVFVACLDYMLDHFDDETLDQVCGAYRDEIEGIRDDLTRLLDVSETESPSIEITQTASVS
jgi:hypothetical protein